MNFTELLTYADIEQVRKITSFYGCTSNPHSKNDCIRVLVSHLNKRTELKRIVDRLKPSELRLLQLLYFDWRTLFNMEELLGMGRTACLDKEESPRKWIGAARNMGWIFPGVTAHSRSLFYISQDLLERLMEVFAEPYLEEGKPSLHLAVIRDERDVFVHDLEQFLLFVKNNEVTLTGEGSIYRQQQRKLFQLLHFPESPIDPSGWRFGFGRRYHQYPDRFSLLYDYAFYRGYIVEAPEGVLRLTEAGAHQRTREDAQEKTEAVRFWMRLYRRPIPHLLLNIRWIQFLASSQWIQRNTLQRAVEQWLDPYYYVSKEELLDRILQMMLYLGMINLGEDEEGVQWLKMTAEGEQHIKNIGRTFETQLDNHYFGIPSSRFSEKQGGKPIVSVE